MKLRLIALSYALLAPGICLAQSNRGTELFGGYSRAGRADPALNGWNASIAIGVLKRLDLVADFSGYYGSSGYSSPLYSSSHSLTRHAFLFGPRFAYRKHSRLTPFTHVLAGLEHDTSKGSSTFLSSRYDFKGSNSMFCVAVGAGLDIKVTRSIAARFIQVDGQGLEQDGMWGFVYRLSTGLVFRLSGGRQ